MFSSYAFISQGDTLWRGLGLDQQVGIMMIYEYFYLQMEFTDGGGICVAIIMEARREETCKRTFNFVVSLMSANTVIVGTLTKIYRNCWS
jgi:hypothetical protein